MLVWWSPQVAIDQPQPDGDVQRIGADSVGNTQLQLGRGTRLTMVGVPFSLGLLPNALLLKRSIFNRQCYASRDWIAWRS